MKGGIDIMSVSLNNNNNNNNNHNNNKSLKSRKYRNIHIGYYTHTSKSRPNNVKEQNLQHGK